MDVPPTLISFAICTADIKHTRSQFFKKTGSKVYIIDAAGTDGLPLEYDQIKKNWDYFLEQRNAGNILTARAIGAGGTIGEVCKAAFGNKIGFKFNDNTDIFAKNTKIYGSIIVEAKQDLDATHARYIGITIAEKIIQFGEESVTTDEILNASEERLSKVF